MTEFDRACGIQRILTVCDPPPEEAEALWDEFYMLGYDECDGCGAVIPQDRRACLKCDEYDINGVRRIDFL